MHSLFRSTFALALLAAATFALAAPPSARPLALAQQARIVAGYGKLPLSFEPNQGQADPQVKFLSRGDGYSLSLTSSEAVLSLHGRNCSQTFKPLAISRAAEHSGPCVPSPESVLRMTLLGSNPKTQIDGRDELPGKSNYFIGSNSSNWHTGIGNYRKVHYSDIYPGVDLVYYGNQRQLEHDFIVAPGADPSRIKLRFNGAEHISIGGAGELLLSTANGNVELRRPVIYQETAGAKRNVSGSYRLAEDGQVGFDIADYDKSRPLIIDPVLAYSTYFGGDYTQAGRLAVDRLGDVFVTGYTSALNFPVKNPVYSSGTAFVSKLNPDGSALLYSTYFGGQDYVGATGIALDAEGSVYITGIADSTFPVTDNSAASKPSCNFNNPCTFVIKFNAAGDAVVYSTLPTYGSGTAITVDSKGEAVIAGYTNFGYPSNYTIAFTPPGGASGSANAFVMKLRADGTRAVYSAVLGGSYSDYAYAVAVDSAGNAYVGGATVSPDFPVLNAIQPIHIKAPANGDDGFIAKINSAGTALFYSTFLGGSSGDEVTQLALGPNDDVFVAGKTYSYDFPTVNPLYGPADIHNSVSFLARLDNAASVFRYSTYLAEGMVASWNDFSEITGLEIDSAGDAYLVADTSTPDLPLVNAFESKVSSWSCFLMEVNAQGSAVLLSTYLGGSGSNSASGLATDTAGNIYVSGFTSSRDFPIVKPFQGELSGPTHNGNPPTNGFITKISPATGIKLSVTNTPSSSIIDVGADITYTIEATNDGPATAEVTISDAIAGKTHVLSCKASGGRTCQYKNSGPVTADFPYLAAGQSATLTVTVSSSRTYGDFNQIVNTATASSIAPAQQVSAIATTTVRETADISIATSLTGNTTGLLHYVHTVTNLGPDNAHAVLLLDPLPAHTSFVSAATTAGECSFHPTIGTDGAVRCPLNNPVAGASAKVDVILQASRDACPTVTNIATVTSQSIDLNSGDDSTTTTTQLPQIFCTTLPPPQYQVSVFYYDDIRSGARYLNNNGDLLGFVPANDDAPFLYKNGSAQPVLLSLQATGVNIVTGFNDLDDVIGINYSYSTGVRKSFLYKNGHLQTLDFGPQFTNGIPTGINNHDQIAGDMSDPSGNSSSAFLYQNGVTQDIGHLPNALYTSATSINGKGEITGTSGTPNNGAFVYSHGLMLSASPPPAASSHSHGIDSSGRVAGTFSALRSSLAGGFLYSGGRFTYLVEGYPAAINDCGEIVGYIPNTGPYLYRHGTFAHLDSVFPFPGNLFNPIAINNRGQILGMVSSSGTQGSAVALLTPAVSEKCGSDARIDNNPDSAVITAGGTITYTIKASNLDTVTTKFTVTDELAAGTDFLKCSVSSGGACVFSPATHSVSADLFNLAKGSTATLTIQVQSSSTYPVNSVIMNTATLSSASTADYLSTAYTSVN